MRERARAVVIGGGVGGCSILYWLTRLGWDDVVLVERADLTSGSTFHSAGLVGQLRSSLSLTRMMMDSVDLYRTLTDEVGLETGWREVGLAAPRVVGGAAGGDHAPGGLGEDVRAPARADLARGGAGAVPADVARRRARCRVPADRRLHRPEPADVRARRGRAPARGGGQHRRRGSRAFARTGDASQGVETDSGVIETEVVVNAGGMFAREIGALAGVVVPIVPMAHEYLVLQPSGLPLDMPTMRDPSLLVYFRPESGGLIMGGYERHCAPWSLDGIPADFNGKLLEEDWPRFEELMQNAIVRVPSLEEMGVVRLINGPEAFTPDGEFILGPSDVRGFWVAAGFCAHGLAGAGGMGKLVAEWIVEGTPSLDVWHMDSRRFGAAYRSQQHTLARTKEVYETYYDVKYPGHERQAGRPLRLSAAYHGSPSSAPCSARSPAGSARTGSSRTRPPATSRCVRAAGPGSSGRRRSARSTRRAARPRRSSTSRPSRRSTCRATAPPRSSSGSARTGSRVRSDASRTRRCSTRAAGSSATSPSRGSPTTASASSPGRPSGSTTWHGSGSTRPRTGRCTSRT